MAMMGTYQRVAVLDCSSGIHMETYDSRAALLIGLLESCEPAELVRLRTVLIPEIEEEQARFDAEIDAMVDTEDGDDA